MNFRTAAAFCLFSTSLLYFFSFAEADPDLWGHLFFGQVIWQEGAIPPRNTYSYTAPAHLWINHEWLAELLFYRTYSLWSSPGLVMLKLAVAGATISILNVTTKLVATREARLAVLIWAMAILSPGFNVRPQIFTYFLFALLLLVLHRGADGNGKAFYWIIPLMGIWVNLHGGFIAGLGAMAIYGLERATGRYWQRETQRQTNGPFFVALGLSVLCLCINPYGLALPEFLARDVIVDRPITEWQPVPLLSFSHWPFKAAVLFVLLAATQKRSWRWDTALALLAALLAFRHQRHTALFAIAAVPILARSIDGLRGWLEDNRSFRNSVLRRWVRAGLAGLIGLQLWAIVDRHRHDLFRIPVSGFDYPTQAADFLARNGIRGNIAVPFDWGEYLIWKLYPESRVSIDGRYTTAYPTEVIQDNWAWMEGKKGWRRLLERYPTEIAITHRRHPVTALLRQDPEWVYIYSDPLAFVFVRKVSSQQRLLEAFRNKKLIPPQTPPLYYPG